MQDDSERLAAAAKICVIVDPSLAVQLVYDIIKKWDHTVPSIYPCAQH